MCCMLINSMVDKRRSGDYRQISGHIPIALYRKFKAICGEYEIAQSDGLEQAITSWVQFMEGQPMATIEHEPKTIADLVRLNLPKIKKTNLGIKNLNAIANGEVLPTKPDFIKIAAAIGLDESQQKKFWAQAFDSSSQSEEISNGHA